MKPDPAATTTAPERPPLFGEFPPTSPAQWRSAAEALLEGASFERRLQTRTPEGIVLRPLYTREDVAGLARLAEPPGRGGRVRGGRVSGNLTRGWEVSQELPPSTPEAFNAVALAELARGQTELNIPLDLASLGGRDPDDAAPGEVGACGLSLATVEDMERAFAGIHLSMISVYLRAGASALPAAALLLGLARRRGVEPRELRGCIEVDPLGMLAWKGDLPVSLARAYDEMAGLTRYAIGHAPRLQTIAVQGHLYHDAGASAVEELGCTLATAVAYLREAGRRGLAIDDATPHVRLALASGSNFFMEVAKFRAARLVWSRAVEALGGGDAARRMHLHVRTSAYNKSTLDAHANILRTTIEALAAVIGGCDGLHVGPFDEVVTTPGALGRRIARNTHAILAEECDLNRVIDPAGGSWYVEWLTDEVSRRSWEFFQEIEARGGMAAALAAGFPQERIAATAAVRAEAVAKRRTVVVGANLYPNPGEPAPDRSSPDYATLRTRRAEQIAAFRVKSPAEVDARVLERLNSLLEGRHDSALETAIDAVLEGASLGEICRTLGAGDEPHPPVTPLRIHRAARPFERLREAALRHAAAHGAAPAVFQANIGPSRLYRLRADWTTGFFEVGGFAVRADHEFSGVDDAAEAALVSGARIVVVTTTDETCETVVEPLARRLRASAPDLCILMAGTPGPREAGWRAAGVDDFVNINADALGLLRRLHERAGIRP